MAITAAVTNAFKADLLAGVHDADDVYKIALYESTATLNKDTTAYTASGEVEGDGYTAGGAELSGYTAGAGTDKAWIDFADPVWTSATLTARGALIYNSTKSNKALCVIDFGEDVSSTNAAFTVQLPAATAAAAILRIA